MGDLTEVIRVTIEATINNVIKNSNLFVYDISTLIISIISVVIAIVSAAIAIWSVKRNEKISYKSKIYERILFEKLYKDFPKIINESIDENGIDVSLNGCSRIENFIKELRIDILAFKYSDEKFYKQLDQALIDIDEKIVLIDKRGDENTSKKYKDFLDAVTKLYEIARKYIT